MYEKVSENMVTNTLMTITLFWRWYVHGTWIADGTHQTLMQSSLSIKALSHYSMKTCILALKKLVSSVCSQEVKGCVMLVSVGKCLSATSFLRVPKTQKWWGLILLMCGWLWWYRWKVMDHLPYSPYFMLIDFCTFGPLKKHQFG